MDQEKHIHHFLPQHYLKGFACKENGSLIWQYTRGREYQPGEHKGKYNPCKMSIPKKAGAIRDYYASTHTDGQPDFNTNENELEKKEKPANPIFTKIRNHQMISPQEKRDFSLYLAQMISRVPRQEHRLNIEWQQSMPEMLQKISAHLNHLSARLEATSNLETEKRNRIHKKIALWRSCYEKYSQGLPILEARTLMANSKRIAIFAEDIGKMTWQFFIAQPGTFFVTADNPVFISPTVGIKGDINSELSFPISSDVALVASRHNALPECFVTATARIVKEINRRAVGLSLQHAYCKEEAKWVTDLLNKKTHFFSIVYESLYY